MRRMCDYHFDIGRDPWLDMLYEDPSREDGYFRDACVFREEIDIPDTMSAAILYENGVQVAYSLNTFMPIEGYHLAFNGHKGRIEIRQSRAPGLGDAGRGRDRRDAQFRRGRAHPRTSRGGRPFRRRSGAAADAVPARAPDPLGQRAGARAGAISVLCGVAADAERGPARPVKVRLAELPS